MASGRKKAAASKPKAVRGCAAKRKPNKKASEETFNVNIRDVRLTKECYKRLSKVKNGLWGNVADAIECGNWWIPVKSHDYDHMKSEFEKGTKDFFDLEQDVCVKDYVTDIISYDRSHQR